MLNKLKRAAVGAHTPHDKATAASKPVPMPLPAQVRILMSQHIGCLLYTSDLWRIDRMKKYIAALLTALLLLCTALSAGAVGPALTTTEAYCIIDRCV